MKNLTLKIITGAVLIIFLHLVQATAATLEIMPNTVGIGAFYNGTTITLTGEIPETAEAVLRVTGEREKLHLKKKGKVGGLLWMNIGDITLENAARVDMIYTPKEIKDIEASGAKSFGLEALKDRISVDPASENKNAIIGEFIKLKKKDGLYTVNPETVSYGPGTQDKKTFSVIAAIPPRMTPGEYSVDLAVIQHDRIIEKVSAMLKIEMVGFPAQLSRLAFNHSLVYGILAVIIALAAGLFIGIMFKNKGGAH